MPETCASCRFWKEPGARSDYRDPVTGLRVRGESDEDFHARIAQWNALYGECDRPVFCPDEDKVSLDDPPPMVTRDGSEYMAILFTLHTFGCRAWEAKP
jgi:hypothetical protein